MKKKINILNVFVLSLGILFLGSLTLNLASPGVAFANPGGGSGGGGGDHKVDICHKNGDSGNWNVVDVDENGWNGHDGHASDYLYIGPNSGNKDQWCKDNQPSDVCANISDLQTSAPSGMEITNGNQCTPIPPTEPQQCNVVSDTTNIIEDGTTPATETWVHPNWINSLPLAKWIWNAFKVTDPTIEETEIFTKTFTVGGPIDSANIKVAADNGYKLEINGNPVVDKLAIENNFSPLQGPTDVSSFLVNGTNTIKFTVKNLARTGQTATENPAGLLYDLEIKSVSCSSASVPVEPKTSTVTMCKVDSEDNPLSGWTLMLKGKNIQNELVVPANISTGVDSSSLQDGISYIAKAVGTWLNQGGANPVDAEYSTTNAWATQMDGYTGYSTDILELQINSQFDPNSNWGTYNSAHTYAQSFIPSVAGPANFRIFDGTGTIQNEGWFGDNSGSLAVDINEGYAGITGENGCTVFNQVPYGTYTTDEIMKSGWENESGLGVVTVNDPTETFTIINDEILIPETIDPKEDEEEEEKLEEQTNLQEDEEENLGENTEKNIKKTNTNNSSSGSMIFKPTQQGRVLGASTCSPYLNSYIKFGNKNDNEEVKKLQEFLNEYLGLDLPVDGIYGKKSFEAVKQFQLKHQDEVLKPWSILGTKNATGYVYKTTQRWINMIKCPDLNIPMPII